MIKIYDDRKYKIIYNINEKEKIEEKKKKRKK